MSSAIVNKENLPRSAKRTEDTTFDRIWKYYFVQGSKVVLTEKEEEIRQRWERSWFHLTNLFEKHLVVTYLMRKHKIDRATAYRDLKSAEMIWGDPSHQSKNAQRAILNHNLKKAMRGALADKDWKAFERLSLRYERVNGLDQEDNDKFAEYMKKKKAAIIVFTADPEALKKQSDDLMEDVEDVEFETVLNEDPEEPGEEGE